MDDPSLQTVMRNDALTLGAVAVAAALLVLLGAWTDGRWKLRAPALAAWLALAAAAAGCWLAYPRFASKPVLSELATDVVQRSIYASAAAAVIMIAVGVAIRWAPRPVRVIVAILLAVAIPAALLYWAFIPFPTPGDLSRGAFLVHQLGPALLASVVMWGLTEPIALRSPGPAAPMVCMLVAAGAGALLLTLSSQTPAFLSFVIAAAAGGTLLAAVVAGLLNRHAQLSGGPVLIWFTLLAALAAADCLDSDGVPVRSLIILALAPALAWVVEFGPMRRWRPWKRELVRAVLVAIPVLVVAIPALMQAKRDMEAG